MNVADSLQRYLPPMAVEALEKIGALAASRGESAYLVGGPVRDLLMK